MAAETVGLGFSNRNAGFLNANVGSADTAALFRIFCIKISENRRFITLTFDIAGFP